jgi:short-subunit dehydrogenase
MTNNKNSKIYLITGASKGIGFDLAQRLTASGHRVIGLARSAPKRPYTFDFFQADLTDVTSQRACMDYIDTAYKRLDGVINNAGIGYGGAVEELPIDAFNKTLQLNVIAVDQLNRLALPLLKASQGIIMHIGSVAGDLAIPFQAYYSASKAALERYSEALRNELKPFKVRVVTIKPGDTQSEFGANRQKIIQEQSPYASRIRRSLKRMEQDEKTGMPTESVYRVVRRLIDRKNPPVSVTVGASYRVLQGLNRLLPKRFVQWLIYQLYGK